MVARGDLDLLWEFLTIWGVALRDPRGISIYLFTFNSIYINEFCIHTHIYLYVYV